MQIDLHKLYQLPDDALVNTQSAAKFIGIEYATLQVWHFKTPERCPNFIQSGRIIRYRIKDLKKWVEDHLVVTEKQTS